MGAGFLSGEFIVTLPQSGHPGPTSPPAPGASGQLTEAIPHSSPHVTSPGAPILCPLLPWPRSALQPLPAYSWRARGAGRGEEGQAWGHPAAPQLRSAPAGLWIHLGARGQCVRFQETARLAGEAHAGAPTPCRRPRQRFHGPRWAQAEAHALTLAERHTDTREQRCRQMHAQITERGARGWGARQSCHAARARSRRHGSHPEALAVSPGCRHSAGHGHAPAQHAQCSRKATHAHTPTATQPGPTHPPFRHTPRAELSLGNGPRKILPHPLPGAHRIIPQETCPGVRETPTQAWCEVMPRPSAALTGSPQTAGCSCPTPTLLQGPRGPHFPVSHSCLLICSQSRAKYVTWCHRLCTGLCP